MTNVLLNPTDLADGNIRIDAFCYQIDTSGTVINDLTPYFVQADSQVERDSCATEDAATARLNFIFTPEDIQSLFGQDTVPWSSMRLRPEVQINGTGEPIELGVFLPETPRLVADKYPLEFQVDCHDLIHALAEPTNGTVVLPGGATIGLEISSIFSPDFAQLVAPPPSMNVSQDIFNIPTPTKSARQWVIHENTTWLLIIDQLLESAGYLPPWTDRRGNLVSEEWVDPSAKPPELILTDASRTSNIALGASTRDDTYGVPNEFTFIATDFDPENTETPVLGNGIVKRSNLDRGPASQNVRGRVVASVQYVDAADQASLELIADREFLRSVTPARTLCLDIAPQPLPWHRGIVEVTISDLGIEREKYMVRSWTLPLDGADANLVMDKIDGVL